MCGISGFYSPDKLFSVTDLHTMSDAIAHRGPDASGYFSNDFVGLGHRRLSIIDLSNNANQPMYSSDKRYLMVYNGEVYNYPEIATELKLLYNIKFRTSSDSEVILEAFANYGPDFVHRLNGMFAIAIYDLKENELYLFRDRIGIKPLYYFWDGKNFAFSSELQSLTKLSSIPLKVNRNAVRLFLHLGFIPAPESIYESIKKLPSGTFAKISKEKFVEKKYWSANNQISQKTISNENEALQELDRLLNDSIKHQIRSDVPFGTFLSGGIDSSLITAKAARISASKINTFSIGFEESRFNESLHAKEVATYLNTQHHEFIVSYKDAINLIETSFETYAEPFADSSSIPTMLVSKLAKQHVTVTLSGDGADELFLGYGSYQWAKRLNIPVLKNFKNSVASALQKRRSYERYANYFRYPQNGLHSHILSQEQNLFSTAEIDDLMSANFIVDQQYGSISFFDTFNTEINKLKRNLKPEESQAFFDLNFYLPDDLLVKVDRASMHYSLETRVPYLDHRIIEFALNISPSLKIHQGSSKYILKKLLYKEVPQKYFDRPKQGFSIPLEKWLKNELYYLIEDKLSKENIEKYDLVKYENVQILIREFSNGKSYLYNRLWCLIVLHTWLETNSDL